MNNKRKRLWKRLYKKTKTTIDAFVNQFLIRGFTPIMQKRFINAWSATLSDHADLYNGLYAGLVRVESGNAKAPHKTLKEWYDRTRFQWEDSEITRLSKKTLNPVIERADPQECAKWAGLLLKAVEGAGIRREEAKTLTLDDTNANAYIEWNGEEIYVGDTVEIMYPAWIQNGKTVERGACTLIASGEE